MSQPTVTVVIPTYNRPEFLSEAVDSVLGQTMADFECIVVDDGSDTEVNLPDDPRIKLLKHGTNQGVAAARNTGIKAARAEWIATLDDDDRWRPTKLQRQLDYIEKNPSTRAVQPEALWYRDGQLIEQKNKHEKPNGEIYPRAMERCLVSASGVMIHQDVFKKVGYYDEALAACEDYDFWLRMGLHFDVDLIEQTLVEKDGGRPDQLSSQPGLDRYRILSLDKLLWHPRFASYRDRAVELMEQKVSIYAGGCRKRGRDREARLYETVLKQAKRMTGAVKDSL